MNRAQSAPVALAIVGPTASGKSSLAIGVARRIGGEIISMDSRQVYRGMDVGTAKATAEQRLAVPHHGLDLADPGERFSAGRFARYARDRIEEIRRRDRVPMLVGGTGFFLRALTNPIFRQPDLDDDRRRGLQRYLEEQEPALLDRWLRALDPEAAARIGSVGGGGGRQRVLRALEMPLLTGRPLTWWQRNAPPEAPPLPLRIFVLDPPRDVLYRAIDARVDAMLEAGLLEEVRRLRRAGYGPGDPALNATGYAELLPVIDGSASVEHAAERIRRNTRAYARRQLTWLRHQLPPGAVWIDPTEGREAVVERIAADWLQSAADGGRARANEPAPTDQTTEGRDAE